MNKLLYGAVPELHRMNPRASPGRIRRIGKMLVLVNSAPECTSPGPVRKWRVEMDGLSLGAWKACEICHRNCADTAGVESCVETELVTEVE